MDEKHYMGTRVQKSGKFVVRAPVSLHEYLAVEAANEGISLNQLVLIKLAMPLHSRLGVPAPKKEAARG